MLSQELKWVLKDLLIQGVQYRTYGKNVESLDRGSESRPHARKHVFGFKQKLILFMRICQKCDDNVKPFSASTG
jgi:hypothetical protein